MKRSIAVVLIVYLLFTPSPLKIEASLKKDVFHQFARALHDKDVSKQNSLIEPHVKIPEIRDKTPISGLSTMPSPRPNTYIMIGSFREEDCVGKDISHINERNPPANQKVGASASPM